MKVGIFSPYAINTPHFETELEIAQKHLDDGDEVIIFYCNKAMPSCDVNVKHKEKICSNCLGRLKSGLRVLNAKGGRLKALPYSNFANGRSQLLEGVRTKFGDLNDLKAYCISNFDIGYGVLSSLVSYLREPTPSLDLHSDVVRDMIHSAAHVYYSVIDIIETHRPDYFYFHNGRFGPLRAAMRACEFKKIDFATVEVGNDNHHYHLFRNTMPHDLNYRISEMNVLWSTADSETKVDKGSSFFVERAKGDKHWWKTFTEGMTLGKLPPNWKSQEVNVGVFISSEDEFVAIGDQFKNDLYRDQLEGITRIVDSLAKMSDHNVHLYIRIHPNLRHVKAELLEPYFRLQNEFTTVIAPDADIDTYTLLQQSNKVISFGSTVGIEAVYWGTPSILIGKSFYEREACYCPVSHDDLITLIQADLSPKDKMLAIKYGYYLKSFGTPFKYYESESIYKGKFKGKFIKPAPTLKKRIKTWLGRLKKMGGFELNIES